MFVAGFFNEIMVYQARRAQTNHSLKYPVRSETATQDKIKDLKNKLLHNFHTSMGSNV